jgi:hypothetical protein
LLVAQCLPPTEEFPDKRHSSYKVEGALKHVGEFVVLRGAGRTHHPRDGRRVR